MTEIEIATTIGRQIAPNADAMKQLRGGLRGVLLLQGEDRYDAARTIYNAMIDYRPAAIARCAGAADVICAVNFARDNGLLVSIRGGGHNVSGNAVSNGGLMIDLSPMKSIRVDPQKRTVRADPGVTWGEFDRETQSFGLATTGGLVSTTGIAGLTLGGGLGWLMGKYGLACDNLISADVVTADGRLLTASKSQNEDLFWGLRGGGGNFGSLLPSNSSFIRWDPCSAEYWFTGSTRPQRRSSSMTPLLKQARMNWAPSWPLRPRPRESA
jgi:FAD/FMN-containing dehydrogenase